MKGTFAVTLGEKGGESRKFVFGPVPSRRLGLSLGVDVVPFKMCPFDCIYCQLGKTTIKTSEKLAFGPIEQMKRQIKEKLEVGPRPDYVTISGSGEPTLCLNLDEVIGAVRQTTDVPVAILTNGALFSEHAVRRACGLADVVLPSLDAGSEEVFRAVNRPCPGLTLRRVVEGLVSFRKEFKGRIWLEVFLVAGVNTLTEELDRIKLLADRIAPDKVQLNTAVRPTAEPYAFALQPDEMARICKRFGPKAEVIADFQHLHRAAEFKAGMDEILAMVRRRPCTLEDIASGLGIGEVEAVKYLERLAREGMIQEKRTADKLYYAGK